MASEAGVAAHVVISQMEPGANEAEYESDTESSLALAMRRRGASDDEEEEEEERIPQGFGGHGSEDDEGAPPLEDEEDDEEEEVEEVMVVADGVEYEEEEENEEIVGLDVLGIRQPRHPGGSGAAGEGGGGDDGVSKGADQGIGSPRNDRDQAEEEKKEAEPFAVPTAGAFYMHDDRFRDNGGARPRRSSGGRKLWEAKDDRAWVHDRFEELNLQDDMGYEEGRRKGGRGRFRGRGRGRDGGRGQGRGNRSKIFEDNNAPSFARRGGGRGRGSRRKEAELRNAGDGLGINKQSSKAADDMLKNSSAKKPSQPGSGQLNGGIPKKHVGSSLSSASPPFYPSGTQHQNIVVPVKSETQHAGAVGSIHTSAVKGEDEMGTSIASTSSRNGKNIVSVRGQAQPHVEPASRSSVEKQPITMQEVSKSSSIHLPQQQKSKVQGRNPSTGGQLINQPTNSGHQLTRGSNFTQTEPMVQQRHHYTQGQGGLRISSQHSVQQTSSNNQSSSRPATSEGGNAASPPGSNKGKSVVGRGRGSPQGAGRSTYGYNGTQPIAGTSGMSVAHAEQSFPPAPALLPLMQFGGQHHAGLRVPAVGMALPGYVAPPQLGFGGSEMTWVPFLAGAAGALGATYCSPYIAVDGGGYYAQPTTQPTTFGVAGRDSSGNKPQNMWKSTPRSELVNDEFGQRQNKPRRYSEMNFGQ